MTKSDDRVIADEAAAEARFQGADMATKILRVGPEDAVTEIDTNADGAPDVRVITDVAPQQALIEGLPDVDPPPGAPFGPGGGSTPDPLLSVNARTWRDRIALGIAP